jgi:hypothetical protein
MRGIGARAVALLLFAAACDPGTSFVAVDGHPGKRGIDGGTDAGEPPPPPAPRALVTLTILIEGTGRVFSPPWFECSSTCNVRIPAGTAFDVLAEGDTGSALESWEGACTGVSACRVSVDEDARLGARFVPAR